MTHARHMHVACLQMKGMLTARSTRTTHLHRQVQHGCAACGTVGHHQDVCTSRQEQVAAVQHARNARRSSTARPILVPETTTNANDGTHSTYLSATQTTGTLDWLHPRHWPTDPHDPGEVVKTLTIEQQQVRVEQLTASRPALGPLLYCHDLLAHPRLMLPPQRQVAPGSQGQRSGVMHIRPRRPGGSNRGRAEFF